MNRIETNTVFRQSWPEPDSARMARDFMLWRHMRVVRARAMRHIRGVMNGSSQPVRSVYGVKMWSNWSDKTYAYCHYGTYGNYLADLLGSIGEPFCFLDIGANQGLFSLIAGTNPQCEAIVSLEPVPDTHARLSANLELNGLGERATALNFGLSTTAETRTITLSKAHSGMATLGSHADQFRAEHSQIMVELATMRELAAHLPPDLPIFVKIDVEGHEETVIRELLGSPEAKRIMAIFYEQDDRWSDNQAITRALGSAGFARLHQYGRGHHYDVLAVPSGIGN